MTETIMLQQASVARLGRHALTGRGLQELMDEAAETIAQVLDADLSSVLELLPDGERLMMRAGSGWGGAVVGSETVPASSTQAGETLATREPVVLDDLRTDRRFTNSTLLRRYGVVSGISVIVRGRERPYGVLGAHMTVRRRFGESDVNFLGGVANVIAAAIQRKEAEDALTEARDELKALIEASPVPIVAYDKEGVVTVWNPAAERVFEWSEAEAVGRLLPIVPDESLGEFHSIRQQVLSGRSFTGFETRRRRKDGTSVDVSFSNAAARDAKGRVRGVVAVIVDITERKRAEEAVRASEKRLRLALEASEMGMWEWSIPTGDVRWSEALEPLYGLEPGTFEGDFEGFIKRVHTEDREFVTAAIQRAVFEGEEFDIEFRVVWPDGTIHWLTGTGEVFFDESGQPVEMIGVTHDVTERRQREEALAFIAETSEALSTSLDYERTLSGVAHMAVPRLADCCVVDVVEESRPAREIAVVHVDRAKEDLVCELEQRYPTDPTSPVSFVGRLIRERRPWLAGALSEEHLREIARDDSHLATLRELELKSAIVVPLIARGRSLGAITLLTGESGRRLGSDNLTLARDLARHAALAVDNARLYRQRAEIATTLQRSLLPPSLPDIPGIELAARYRAAGEGVDAGGDFYDAFQISEKDWIIAVGDVCGKGPAAAALTGLARHTLHASALRERRPSRILAILNEAILRQSEETTFCTLVCGRLERRNHALGLTFACGGHPLPLVVAANGDIQTVGCYGTLVGVFADAEFADETLELEPGETLVLYTDGLIEAYGEPVEAGQGRLAEVIRACAGAPAEEMAGRIERSITGGQTDRDDITFLVLRVAG